MGFWMNSSWASRLCTLYPWKIVISKPPIGPAPQGATSRGHCCKFVVLGVQGGKLSFTLLCSWRHFFPMVIYIVTKEEKINAYLPALVVVTMTKCFNNHSVLIPAGDSETFQLLEYPTRSIQRLQIKLGCGPPLWLVETWNYEFPKMSWISDLEHLSTPFWREPREPWTRPELGKDSAGIKWEVRGTSHVIRWVILPVHYMQVVWPHEGHTADWPLFFVLTGLPRLAKRMSLRACVQCCLSVRGETCTLPQRMLPSIEETKRALYLRGETVMYTKYWFHVVCDVCSVCGM